MSLGAILTTVRNHLRTGSIFTFANDFKVHANQYAEVIGVQLAPGRPDPGFGGQRYLAIWGSQWNQGAPGISPDVQLALAETYGVTLTLTHRLEFTPEDNIPETVYYTALTGMVDVARKAMLAIHQNNTLWGAANTAISASGTDSFISWLNFEGADASPREVGADWFSESPDANSMGLVMDIRFGGASRLKCLQ